MKQLITRVDESLAASVKAHAAAAGESVNAFVTHALEAAVGGGRRAWKERAVARGLLGDRPAAPRPKPTKLTTRPGYGSDLVSAERDER